MAETICLPADLLDHCIVWETSVDIRVSGPKPKLYIFQKEDAILKNQSINEFEQ